MMKIEVAEGDKRLELEASATATKIPILFA